MSNREQIRRELTQLSELLALCIAKLATVRHMLLDDEVCSICRKRVADSTCQCGLNLCTDCELTHKHTGFA